MGVLQWLMLVGFHLLISLLLSRVALLRHPQSWDTKMRLLFVLMKHIIHGREGNQKLHCSFLGLRCWQYMHVQLYTCAVMYILKLRGLINCLVIYAMHYLSTIAIYFHPLGHVCMLTLFTIVNVVSNIEQTCITHNKQWETLSKHD